METPLSSVRRGNAAPFATPAITPKFDITTPLNRSVMRLARPDETLVSLSGSPVYAPPSTQKRKNLVEIKRITVLEKQPNFFKLLMFCAGGRGKKEASTSELLPIPLGNGRNLMVPLGV